MNDSMTNNSMMNNNFFEKVKRYIKRHKVVVFSAIGSLVVLCLVACVLFLYPGFLRKQLGLDNMSEFTAIEQPANTELQKAIPQYDRQWALMDFQAGAAWPDLLAVPQESYTLKYQASQDNSKDVAVSLGQWPNEKNLASALDEIKKSYGDSPQETGEVKAQGEMVGNYYLFSEALDNQTSQNQSVIIWSNKTVIIQAVGDKALLKDFYNGYIL
ncbi:MAG: hypothetical protein LBT85_00630 [Bifidobacteriaceae bacterium]|jgi:hypothetical protein|nr:hypothetical protein [Bifidobacteriaceae bacterium]